MTITKRAASRALTQQVYALQDAQLETRADKLPTGVCGIVTGVALVYGVIDAWRTRFLPGCLDKTRNKVAAGKVKLFSNHGAVDGYGTRSHVGTVRSLVQVGMHELMTAHLFDTEDGRREKEYLSAVMASESETGLSIGFFDRAGDWNETDDVYEFTEIELDEISLAPRNAVPGADVLAVRRQPITVTDDAVRGMLDGLKMTMGESAFRALLDEYQSHADEARTLDPDPIDSAALADEATRAHVDGADIATMADRLAAVRHSFAYDV